mgnify:CR=1 FL=1
MLTVNVKERPDINKFMAHPWISNNMVVPSTPLLTSQNMLDNVDCLQETQQEMAAQLHIMRVDAVFFRGRTHFSTTNFGIWKFFGQESYIHFVAQETRIIRKLIIFF